MPRRNWFAIIAILTALLAIPGLSLAAGNDNGTDHFGPMSVATTDGSSCGDFWADDTFDRYWSVHDNGDGTFMVMREDKHGTFVTREGQSPGGCSDSLHHGSTVAGGITGRMSGYFAFDVVSSSYDPSGCDNADCSSTENFLAVVFPDMTDYCSSVCRWNFEYSSSDRSLTYRHWQDKSDTSGNDVFVGDIATQ